MRDEITFWGEGGFSEMACKEDDNLSARGGEVNWFKSTPNNFVWNKPVSEYSNEPVWTAERSQEGQVVNR